MMRHAEEAEFHFPAWNLDPTKILMQLRNLHKQAHHICQEPFSCQTTETICETPQKTDHRK